MFNFFKKPSGFSIIEVIAAIFIIAVGLTGILSLVIQNVQAQYINKNALIASQLAQEGLELTRNVRDKNWLDGSVSWVFTGIAAPSGNKIFIIKLDGAITEVTGIDDDDAKLKIDDAFYFYGSGNDSGFSRIIQTENDYSASSTVVSCIVGWQEKKGGAHRYAAETVLYDWR